MPSVMPVRVLVRFAVMRMPVPMTLGEVQIHADGECYRAQEGCDSCVSFS